MYLEINHHLFIYYRNKKKNLSIIIFLFFYYNLHNPLKRTQFTPSPFRSVILVGLGKKEKHVRTELEHVRTLFFSLQMLEYKVDLYCTVETL